MRAARPRRVAMSAHTGSAKTALGYFAAIATRSPTATSTSHAR